jgi:16S rRNA (cytosine1402-N4)-methyltransferase
MRSPSTVTVGASLSAAPAAADRERQLVGEQPVGGLRMSQVPYHLPVMLSEVLGLLSTDRRGLIVDATLGGGGHSAALLAANPSITVVGIDRDPDALAEALGNVALYADRFRAHHARFDAIASVIEEVGGGLPVLGVLFDLGVSSAQLDRAERGFSYRSSGPLDMRMDPSQGLTAAEVVNDYDERALATLFRDNGEGRFGSRIAHAIVRARPITDTATLAELVRNAIPAPARRRGGHPAKRIFQAIRIEVNAELDVLRPALTAALSLLDPGGRLVVISYHSGEDRLVKATLSDAATGGCTCPPGLPCVCGAVTEYRLVFRGGRTPTAAELAANPRAESARMRAIERLQP